MGKKKLIKNIVIKNDSDDDGVASFQQTINIPFTPDILKVKGVSIARNENQLAETFHITSDLVNYDALTIFSTGEGTLANGAPIYESHSIVSEHVIDNPINGSYNFNFISSGGISTTYRGTISIMVEFIKYLE